MNTLFVPYESAVKLKELGFSDPCITFYSTRDKNYLDFGSQSEYWGDSTGFQERSFRLEKPFEEIIGVPLYQQTFDWFKRKHNLFVTIHIHEKGYSYNIQNIKGAHGMIEMLVSTILSSMASNKYFETEEIAREEALKDLIKLKSK